MARWRHALIISSLLALAAPVVVVAQDQPGQGEPGKDQRSEVPPPSPEVDPEDVDETSEVLGTVEDGRVVVTLPNGRKVVMDDDGDDRDLREDIPFGATVDVSQGKLRIGKSKKAAQFYGGKFKIERGQRIRKKSKKRLTEIDLVGPLSCPRKGKAVAAAGRRKRRLWGNGQGTFKTNGRHSAATVRGTKWLIEDTCKGTLVRVVSGSVSVYDKVRKRRRIVRAGEQLLTPPPRRR